MNDYLKIYYKKSVQEYWNSQDVKFDIPFTGFSSSQLDIGSLALLEDIKKTLPKWNKILDLGCGYGTISLNIAINSLAKEIYGVDRDALAVAYSKHNAEINSIKNVTFYGGLGFEDFEKNTFDAIISNIPAKVGFNAHKMMLLQSSQYLTENGEVWIVVVKPLEETVDKILNNENIELIHKINHHSYFTYHYKFKNKIPDDQTESYFRNSLDFQIENQSCELNTFYGLPEFDNLSFSTELLLKTAIPIIEKNGNSSISIINPNQGHLPVFLTKAIPSIKNLMLYSRDALSLKCSKMNLHRNGYKYEINQFHTPFWDTEKSSDNSSFYVGVLDEDERVEINCSKIYYLLANNPNSKLLFACSASIGSRLQIALRKKGIKISILKKRKRFSILIK